MGNWRVGYILTEGRVRDASQNKSTPLHTHPSRDHGGSWVRGSKEQKASLSHPSTDNNMDLKVILIMVMKGVVL